MKKDYSELGNYVDRFLENESKSILRLKEFVDDEFFRVLEFLTETPRRIVISGAGTSAIIARRMTHLFSCIEENVSYLHSSDGLHGASGTVQKDDVVFVFSKGGASDEVNQFAAIVKKRGAYLISITEMKDSILGKMSDFVILYSSIENKEQETHIAFSNSLSAGAIADALAIGLMKLKGYDGKDFGSIHPGGAVGKELNPA
jgi:arabinose-5-phosphate isomerase